jgi:hypothetical protein
MREKFWILINKYGNKDQQENEALVENSVVVT